MLAILSAMPDEINHLLQAMSVKQSIEKGQRIYYHGDLFGQNCVMVFSRWGKVAAATTITQLINLFPVKELIFSGVAGAIHTGLEIGDIVVATELIQHDMDASPLFKPAEIPLLNKSVFKTKTDDKMWLAIKKFKNDFQDLFKHEALYFNINEINATQGIIVSGDQFIHTKAQRQSILKLIPEALCAEMEGAAVGQVCYEYGLPLQVIRIISDKANAEAEIDFPELTRQLAGKYTYHILKNYLTN